MTLDIEPAGAPRPTQPDSGDMIPMAIPRLAQ